MTRMDPYEIAARLNESCQCVGADVVALQQGIERRLREALPELALASSHPHLFSAVPIFLTDVQAEQMRTLIAAIESVVALPAFQQQVLKTITFESMQMDKKDWDRIVNLK